MDRSLGFSVSAVRQIVDWKGGDGEPSRGPTLMTDPGQVDMRSEADRIRAKAATILQPVRLLLMGILAMEPSVDVQELAQYLQVSVRTVRRHISVLIQNELAAVEREESRRGVVKRYYAARGFLQITSREDTLLTDAERRRVSLVVIRLIVRELARAAIRPEMSRRPDRVVANAPGLVDERGWTELSELHHGMLNRVEAVIVDARQRVAAGAEPIRVISQQVLLETSSYRRSRAGRHVHAQKKLN